MQRPLFSRNPLPPAKARGNKQLRQALLTARHYISHISANNPPKDKKGLLYAYNTIDAALKPPRKNPFPKGRTPPHLKKYLFKKGHK